MFNSLPLLSQACFEFVAAANKHENDGNGCCTLHAFEQEDGPFLVPIYFKGGCSAIAINNEHSQMLH